MAHSFFLGLPANSNSNFNLLSVVVFLVPFRIAALVALVDSVDFNQAGLIKLNVFSLN